GSIIVETRTKSTDPLEGAPAPALDVQVHLPQPKSAEDTCGVRDDRGLLGQRDVGQVLGVPAAEVHVVVEQEPVVGLQRLEKARVPALVAHRLAGGVAELLLERLALAELRVAQLEVGEQDAAGE